MTEFRLLFQKAFADEVVRVPCTARHEAGNLRQRLYRYRDMIRADDSDKLNLLVDHLHFELGVRELIITYYNPNEKILEALNDNNQTGDRSPNLSKQHKPTQAHGQSS